MYRLSKVILQNKKILFKLIISIYADLHTRTIAYMHACIHTYIHTNI